MLDRTKKLTRSIKENPPAFFHNKFPRYSEIQTHLRVLCKTYPNYVKIETIGKTYQGRKIDMVVISKFKNRKNRMATFIDATIHAREWLSNSTLMYFIDYVVKNRSILSLMDFYIVPCLNPDGYEYTHTQNRLWRKNRNTNKTKIVEKQGVDLNRNFPYGYGLQGSSSDPGSFMYRGECPLSEPEAQALALTLDKYKKKVKLYISLHCYGNVILFPWGFTKENITDRHILEECAYECRNAIQAAGQERTFRVGSTASKMYISSGGSADYAKGCNKIKFCYTIELQRYGKSGFTPSTKRIVEIGHETTMGILAMVRFVYNYYQEKNCEKMVERIDKSTWTDEMDYCVD